MYVSEGHGSKSMDSDASATRFFAVKGAPLNQSLRRPQSARPARPLSSRRSSATTRQTSDLIKENERPSVSPQNFHSLVSITPILSLRHVSLPSSLSSLSSPSSPSSPPLPIMPCRSLLFLSCALKFCALESLKLSQVSQTKP